MKTHDLRFADYVRTIHSERYENAHTARLLKLARASQPKAPGDLSQSPDSATSAPNLGRLSRRRTAQAVQAYWWVPAGFAGLVLVRSILGG